jgi:hypothetical protein
MLRILLSLVVGLTVSAISVLATITLYGSHWG